MTSSCLRDEEVKDYIKSNEGCKLTPYKDSLGFWTVGYGHFILKKEEYLIGTTITQEAGDALFEHDFMRAVSSYKELDLILDDNRRMVIFDMLFQLGLTGVMKFKRMLSALRKEDWKGAAHELMDSYYAKQVPSRAKKNHDILLSDESKGVI